MHSFTGPFCLRHLDMVFLISQRIYEQALQTAVEVLWSLGSLHSFRWTSLVSQGELQTQLDGMLHGYMIRIEEVTWPSKAETERERQKEKAVCNRRRCRSNTEDLDEQSRHGSQFTNCCCQRTRVHTVRPIMRARDRAAHFCQRSRGLSQL